MESTYINISTHVNILITESIIIPHDFAQKIQFLFCYIFTSTEICLIYGGIIFTSPET